MGSKDSKEAIFRDNSLISFDENESEDYNGVKTFDESFHEDDILENFDINTKILTTTKIIDKGNSNKIPVTFEWEHGGNFVYLTGSFCNWDQFFLMEKNQNGKFTLTLNLNKGFIQYKFKVDNEWKCNENYPTIMDNGNKNNFIDTTNWEITAEKSDETTNSNTEESIIQNENKSRNLTTEFKNSQLHYSKYIPKKNEMSGYAQKIPEEYKSKINLDKKESQNKFGKNSSEENIFGENYAYKSIKPFYHEQINHLNIKEYKTDINKNNICSIVSRYRLKFTTFVYYKNK